MAGSRLDAPPPRVPAKTTAATELRSLRMGLSGADDTKVRQVARLVDAADDPSLNRALLEPLRARLAALQPTRRLRLPRLLFMPFDPLIVPARGWRPDDPTVPRSTLIPLSRTVEASLGADKAAIEDLIEGAFDEQVDVIADAGALLWPAAAKIAAEAHAPPRWAEESGLPDAAFAPLVHAMATVWRRAPQLRLLFRTGQIGALQVEATAVEAIMAGTPSESALGCAMVARLILLQSPFAARQVRLFASASARGSDKVTLQKAISGGIDDVVNQLEQPDAFTEAVRHAPLNSGGDYTRTIITLLHQIEDDASSRMSPSRLKAVRDNLDGACRSRFAQGMKAEVLQPLAAAEGVLDSAAQMTVEAAARDLRMLELAARGLGGAADYDTLLQAGTQAINAARERGVLTRIGEIRLVEILAGPDAALRLYRR